MPPRFEEEWSDSEDENISDVETCVLLGIPDGQIDEPLDVSDPAVSRIGGYPVFLPTRPLSPSTSHCKLCSELMPLLVQMWCPFEGSAMDRVLYIWGCERSECQRKEGSVRAWRGLKFNHEYATKLATIRARETEKAARKAAQEAKDVERKGKQSINPFSASVDGPTQMTFGLGTQLFGVPTPTEKVIREETSASGSETSDNDAAGDEAVDSVAKQLDSTTLEPGPLPAEWASVPSYKPIYLSTISEYIPPPPKGKGKSPDFPDDDVDDKKSGTGWGLEGWENSADVDCVFDKFVNRVSGESEQCVRYDLNGTPLPFGSRDSVYKRLFPSPPPAPFTTKPGFAAPIVQRRTYDPGVIGKCGACGGRRVFECQLMPNLINVLREQGKKTAGIEGGRESRGAQTEEDRKKALESALTGGMEWGTCMVFSCEKDCYSEGEEETWKEELLLVQWE